MIGLDTTNDEGGDYAAARQNAYPPRRKFFPEKTAYESTAQRKEGNEKEIVVCTVRHSRFFSLGILA